MNMAGCIPAPRITSVLPGFVIASYSRIACWDIPAGRPFRPPQQAQFTAPHIFSEKPLHIREAIRYDSGLFRRTDKRRTKLKHSERGA